MIGSSRILRSVYWCSPPLHSFSLSFHSISLSLLLPLSPHIPLRQTSSLFDCHSPLSYSRKTEPSLSPLFVLSLSLLPPPFRSGTWAWCHEPIKHTTMKPFRDERPQQSIFPLFWYVCRWKFSTNMVWYGLYVTGLAHFDRFDNGFLQFLNRCAKQARWAGLASPLNRNTA